MRVFAFFCTMALVGATLAVMHNGGQTPPHPDQAWQEQPAPDPPAPEVKPESDEQPPAPGIALAPPPINAHAQSVPIGVGSDDFGFNIRSALDASGGALKDVMIGPGETWSFNASIGEPRWVQTRKVAGVDGGGWCDLASRYVQAARQLGVPDSDIIFRNHIQETGQGLWNVESQDTVTIWITDGQAGFENGNKDLLIANSSTRPIWFRAVDAGDSQVVIEGWRG